MNIKTKKGFSLLELILVLGVGTMVAFMKFQDMKNEQEAVIAKTVGQQIKQIGEAVNGYINIRYDKLSTLTSSSSQSSDPGPRTCNTNTCEITYQTLINEGLLPSTYTGVNAQNSSYKIILKRDGSSPNYVINGLVMTTLPWSEGGKTRYDLLGKAMQGAGIDSGMTQSASSVSGYSGAWSNNATDFNNITQTGLLGYRVGYDSAMYSVYLRRDGTLPMTGDLDMGGKNINNVQNITASGTGEFGSKVATNGFDPTDIPTGWAGGIRTWDIVAGGTVASLKKGSKGTDGNIAAYMNPNGEIYASNSVTSSGIVLANGRVTGGDIYSQSETYTNNWFRTMGDGGIYFQKYGGGWYMTDTNTISAYANKNISTANGVYGGYIHSSGNIDSAGDINSNRVLSNYIQSNGRVVAGEYVQINGQAQTGGECSPNGLQGRTPEGAILSCVNGVWSKVGADLKSTTYVSTFPHNVINMGQHTMCTLSYARAIKTDNDYKFSSCEVSKSGNNWTLTSTPQTFSNYHCEAVCLN